MDTIKGIFRTMPPEYYFELAGIVFFMSFFGFAFNTVIFSVILLVLIMAASIPMLIGDYFNEYFYTPKTLFTKRKWIMQKKHYLLSKKGMANCPVKSLYRKFRRINLQPDIEYVAVTHKKIMELIEKNPDCFEYIKLPERVYKKDVNKIKKSMANRNCTKENCKAYPCWSGKKDVQQFYYIRFKIKPSKVAPKYPSPKRFNSQDVKAQISS